MWYTGKCSPNGDQSVRGATHYDITMGNDMDRDIHCYVTMSNDVAMCRYHDIAMHNDNSMNLFYQVFSALCLIVWFYYG